jgi:hypothetical protein
LTLTATNEKECSGQTIGHTRIISLVGFLFEKGFCYARHMLLMRLSKKRVKELQVLIYEQIGKTLTDEEAQLVGLAIVRFMLAKSSRANINNSKPTRRYHEEQEI